MFDGKGVVCAFCNLLKNTDLAEKIGKCIILQCIFVFLFYFN